MQYRFAIERPDYSDLASGRVFYNLPGYPAFPVRLVDEIFQRCFAIRNTNRLTEPCRIYDPCCGTGYHLGVLTYLHWESIREIIGSDIDQEALRVTQKNLGLLNPKGIDQRIAEVDNMLKLYGKISHQEALDSAHRLRERIGTFTKDHPLKTRTFQANVLDKKQLQENMKGTVVDIVFADVPYGQQSQWQNPGARDESSSPLWQMLDALLGILSPDSVVAIAFDKKQKALHESYRRLEQFQVGKRRMAILKPDV